VPKLWCKDQKTVALIVAVFCFWRIHNKRRQLLQEKDWSWPLQGLF